MTENDRKPLTYRQAGVDIEAGDRLVDAIKPLAALTRRPGVSAGLGGFGALFDLKAEGFDDPVLVSGTDGVGTKLILAFETGRHDTIGIDLVAMCVNDVLCQGAEPLFFLDYFATGRLEPDVAEAVIKGIADGCALSGCALIGGETAEMPGLYGQGHYDLAGFVVGAAERANVLPNHAAMTAGDVLIGLPSSGPHSNGYSLIRRIVERTGLTWETPAPFDPTKSLGSALLEPTRIYTKPVLALIASGALKGAAHITGGGLTENTPRMCPEGLAPRLDETAWTPLPVFEWLQSEGAVDDGEMRRTFNMGIGMVLCVSPDHVPNALDVLKDAGEDALIIGELAAN
ncbi:MAG: phosphoribosylformylglycinamidine cyclo-ligase [Pseudomonadota bacterium]